MSRGALPVVASAALLAAATAATYPPSSNQTVLTARESQRLVDYSTALRSCLRRQGFAIARPDVTRRQIALAVSDASSQRDVVLAGLRCSRTVGDPPLDSSLQTFRDRIVLYVPKQCLIDEDVARRR